MRDGRFWRAGVGIGIALGTGLVAMTGAPACFPQGACDASPERTICRPGTSDCPGNRIDETHWQTNPIDGKWLSFPRASQLEVYPRDGSGALKGTVMKTFAWISVCETPVASHCNYALAAGNNALFFPTDRGTFYVRNDTCEDLYVRVLLESDGIVGDGGVADAAAEASSDAATGDATTD